MINYEIVSVFYFIANARIRVTCIGPIFDHYLYLSALYIWMADK